MIDKPEVTADNLTDEMVWQVVKAAAAERNAVLLGYCAVALRQKTGGGLRHAREVLCDAINARAKADALVECPTCLGVGRIRDSETNELRRCLDCGGSGQQDARAKATK